MSLEQATQEYLNGTKMKDVLTKYPDLNRQKIYYNVRKVKKSFEAEERSEGVEKENVNGGNDAENGENIDANNVENENNNVEEIINSVKMEDEPFIIQAESFGMNEIIKPAHNPDEMLSDFGYLFKDVEDALNPSNVQQPQPRNPVNDVKPPTLKQMERDLVKSTKKEEPINETQEDNKRFKIIHQIRLYVYNYEHVKQLHIIKPTPEKFIIELYNKKEQELNKLLNFIKFHVRFCNKTVSTSLLSNGLTIGTKLIEHLGGYLGADLRGLTEDVAHDDEIQDTPVQPEKKRRCRKGWSPRFNK